MAESQTEATMRLLSELIVACHRNTLREYIEEYASSQGERDYLAHHYQQAVQALAILDSLGEYIVKHHV